jgi:hypothetical protein
MPFTSSCVEHLVHSWWHWGLENVRRHGLVRENTSQSSCLWKLSLTPSPFLILCFLSTIRWKLSSFSTCSSCHECLVPSNFGLNPLKLSAKIHLPSLSWSLGHFSHRTEKVNWHIKYFQTYLITEINITHINIP